MHNNPIDGSGAAHTPAWSKSSATGAVPFDEQVKGLLKENRELSRKLEEVVELAGQIKNKEVQLDRKNQELSCKLEELEKHNKQTEDNAIFTLGRNQGMRDALNDTLANSLAFTAASAQIAIESDMDGDDGDDDRPEVFVEGNFDGAPEEIKNLFNRLSRVKGG